MKEWKTTISASTIRSGRETYRDHILASRLKSKEDNAPEITLRLRDLTLQSVRQDIDHHRENSCRN